ncbi:MAG TPA: glycosyltransferase [Desulfotomaculum sp.]|nr:glycosyltransferase [Desulfotomaculum sp.]
MKQTIGLAMIVRDEEENLANCLKSVQGLVDEIVVVDTGSADRTVEIARRYTDKVFLYHWHNDFSAARNFAITRTGSDWILSLDADEQLDAVPADLRVLANNDSGYEAYLLPLCNRTPESTSDYSRFPVLRFFRNSAEYRFRGRIHEQVTVSRPGVVGIAERPVIWHQSRSGKERNRKRGRNLTLLRRSAAAEPNNPFLQYYLGVEWLGLGKAAKALPCLQESCARLTDTQVLFRAPAVRFLVICLKTLGKIDEAICVCIEESLRYPAYTDLFFEGGVLFEQRGEYEIAIKWFKEAINCGRPPAIFSHTNGTESFLSLYHLGYCHEKLGRPKPAKDYYEHALSSEPGYIYPLYGLFLLCLAEKGPQGAFEHLKLAGHLACPEQAEALAELFFEAGCAELACACLESAAGLREPAAGERSFTSDKNMARRLARFLVYAGRFEEALALIDCIRCTGGEIDRELTATEVVALILQEEYKEAKTKAFSLWRRAEGRDAAWALVNLISLCRNGSLSGRPEKNREAAVVQATVEILENCLRHAPMSPGTGISSSARLAAKTIELLIHLSPLGCTALSAYLQGKAAAVRRMMEYKCGPAGRLLS